VVAAVHDGLEFAHTLVFWRVASTTRYRSWLGAGDFFAMIKGEELLDATVRDVFSACLKRSDDVLIQIPAYPKIQPYIPDWLRPAAGARPGAATALVAAVSGPAGRPQPGKWRNCG